MTSFQSRIRRQAFEAVGFGRSNTSPWTNRLIEGLDGADISTTKHRPPDTQQGAQRASTVPTSRETRSTPFGQGRSCADRDARDLFFTSISRRPQ